MKLIIEVEILKAKNTTKAEFFKDIEVGDKLILESFVMYPYDNPDIVKVLNQRNNKTRKDFAGNIHRYLDTNFKYKIDRVYYDVKEFGMGGN